MVLYLF